MESTLPMPTTPTLCSLLLFPLLIINPRSRIVDVEEPSGLLSASVEFLVIKLHEILELDRSFKFGGPPKFDVEKEKETEGEREREN